MTGKAVEKCALELKDKICTLGAQMLGLDKAAVLFNGDADKRGWHPARAAYSIVSGIPVAATRWRWKPP